MSIPPRNGLAKPTESERAELLAYARKELERSGAVKGFLSGDSLPGSISDGGGTLGDLADALFFKRSAKKAADLYVQTGQMKGWNF